MSKIPMAQFLAEICSMTQRAGAFVFPQISRFDDEKLVTGFTRAEFEREICGSPEQLFKNLGLSGKEQGLLWSEFYRNVPSEILKEVILGEYARVPLSRVFSTNNTVPHLEIPWDSKIKFIQRDKQTRFKLTEDGFDDFRERTFGRYSPFEANFFDIRAAFVPEREAIWLDSIVFVMQLPQAEHEALFKLAPPGKYSPCFDEYFAIARFKSNEQGRVELLEVRNDWYQNLRDPSLLEKYKDWKYILFDALINYVQHNPNLFRSVLQEIEVCEVNEILFDVPDLEALKTRWSERKLISHQNGAAWRKDENNNKEFYVPAVPLETLQDLYVDLPKHFNFESFDLGNGDPYEFADMKALHYKTGLRLKLQLSSNEIKPFDFTNLPAGYSQDRSSRFEKFIGLYEQLFSPDSFLTDEKGKIALSHPISRNLSLPQELRNAFEFAPTVRLNREIVPGMNAYLKDSYIKILEQNEPPEIIWDILESNFVPISKGIGHGISDKWWDISLSGEPGWKFHPVHCEFQNRHPQIRLIHYSDDGKVDAIHTLGFKGSGVGALTDTPVEIPDEEIRLPIYRRLRRYPDRNLSLKDPDNHALPGHSFWGGIDFRQMNDEFKDNISLIVFLQHALPWARLNTPLPLASHAFRSIPGWDSQGGTHWFGPNEYSAKFLKEKSSPDTLCSLVTFSGFDVRISQLVDRIFHFKGEETDFEQIKDRIDSALSTFYLANGFEINLPKFYEPAGEEFDSQAILKYLNRVHDFNPVAARQIYRKIYSATFDVMSAIHGAQGHLGGGYIRKDQPCGVRYGGSTALRNTDITGAYHDFATACFPWNPEYNASAQMLINRYENIGLLQSCDILYWRESMYWIEKVLFGAKSGIGPAEVIRLSETDDITLFTGNDRRAALIRDTIPYLTRGIGPEPKYMFSTDAARKRYEIARGLGAIGTEQYMLAQFESEHMEMDELLKSIHRVID